jgi:methionyl-tRNA formyltransferase
MGTPEFAVPSLDILVRHHYDIVGVVTSTDKKGGRGKKKLLQSAVKQYALSHGIPVFQPPNLKSPAFQAELAALEADLQVVVAFRMLPEAVWAMPKLGTFNLHGSLLPKYRGAAPINWAIIKGEQETGVTTFFIQHEIDTGDVLFQEKMAIGENETAGEVHDRMMQLGAEVVLKTVQAIEKQDYVLKRQDDSLATKAPKIYHETCEIDFRQPALSVHNFIRGLSPYPAAWAMLQEHTFKILRTQLLDEPHDLAPGQLLTDNKSYLKITCADGMVQVLDLQMQGRKRMKVKDFLNGFDFE